MLFAERMWERTKRSHMPKDHRHVALAVGHLLDEVGDRGYVTAGEVADATSITRPTIIRVCAELGRDHLLDVGTAGAAYTYAPGPALTHEHAVVAP